MIFNSIPFAIFFVCFYLLYWYIANRSLKIQNALLLFGSYFFYAFWDWRFLSLLLLVSTSTYFSGKYLDNAQSERKKSFVLWANIIGAILMLLYFKYTNFLITSFVALLDILGFKSDLHTLQIILPLGISFYLFRTISYLLDINKGKIKPCEDATIYFTYVAFFPSLISGPIDRAKLLVPQLEKERKFDYIQFTDALRQILWGLFKKIVVADNIALATSQIFEGYLTMSPNILLLGAIYFSVQLYADFSGYSDMAIGCARLLGLNITKNFDYPFFSQNIAEFWRKWHISLTSWLTEFIFTPITIKLRDYEKLSLAVGIITTFLISGLWHGANWTFVVWGLLYGIYYVPSIIRGTMLSKKKKTKTLTLGQHFVFYVNMIGLFLLVSVTNVLFKATSLSQGFGYIQRMWSTETLHFPMLYKAQMPFVVVLFGIEWLQRDMHHGLQSLGLKWPTPLRWLFYFVLMALIFIYNSKEQQFIYFQF